MRVKVKGYDDLVTLVGNLLEMPTGSVLLCEGDWKMDKRYGSQFFCQSWEEVMPATVYGIEKRTAGQVPSLLPCPKKGERYLSRCSPQ